MTQRLQHLAFSFLLAFGAWLLLVGSLQGQELTLGLLVAGVATVFAAGTPPLLSAIRLVPDAPWHLLRYVLHFSLALLRANLDVARRVVSPSLPIRPAVVTVRTELQSDLAKLVLANSITLTPGTLTIDIAGDTLLVHWIDAPPDVDLTSATRGIAAGFERHLRGFLE